MRDGGRKPVAVKVLHGHLAKAYRCVTLKVSTGDSLFKTTEVHIERGTYNRL